MSQEKSKNKTVYNADNPSPLWLRLVEIVGEDNGSVIGAAFGVKKQSAYHWRDGGSPGREKLKEFAESKGVSLHWLMTGEGEKYLQPSAPNNVQLNADLAPAFVPATETPQVRYYELKAYELSAKPYQTASAMVETELLRNRSISEVIALRVSGNDFVNEGYRAGRHLTVVPATPEELQPGDEIVTYLDGRFIIRLLEERQNDILSLRHLSRLVPPIYARVGELKMLYRVVG